MGPNGQVGPTIIGGGGSVVVGMRGTSNVSREPAEVMILAEIELPPGLQESDIERLVLARGVPTPSGERGEICIVREEDGKPLAGAKCN
jgi:hypothetical protein